MRSKSQLTDVVMPLEDKDDGEDAANDEMTGAGDHDCELDWCFDDAELTRQLRAVKRGRGMIITIVVASTLLLGAAVGLAL